MQPLECGAKRASNLLLLSLLVVACCCCAGSSSAIDLKRSFSFGGFSATAPEARDGVERVSDPLKFADDSLITRSGKSNKVSKLLRFIHNKAEDALYRRNDPSAKAAAAELPELADAKLASGPAQTDDEVISSVCTKEDGVTCKYAVKAMMRARPEDRAVVARAIRHKPAYVDGSKLLYHKLFETAIARAEERKLDEKIDLGINLIAKKSPYGWAATKALDLAASKLSA